jgi:transcriptional regulator NrdR family protein
MKCPFCQSKEIRIVDTRKFETVVIRTRVCDACHAPFQTQEEIHLLTPIHFKVIFPSSEIPK